MEENHANKSEGGFNRRELMRRGAGGALGLTLSGLAYSTVQDIAAASQDYNWETWDTDRSDTTSDNTYDYFSEMSSDLRYIETYVGDTHDIHEFQITTKNLGRKEKRSTGDMYNDRSVDYSEVEWVIQNGDSHTDLLGDVDNNDDYVGARPPAADDYIDGSYSAQKYMFEQAISIFSPGLSVIYDAATLINDMRNDYSSRDPQESETDVKYNWNYDFDKAELDYFSTLWIRTTEGKVSDVRVSAWNYWAGGLEWMDNSWRINYDGSTLHAYDTKGSSMAGGNGSNWNRGKGRPEGKGWEKKPAPEDPPQKKVPLDSFPEDSPVRDIVDNRDYVIKTQYPFYVKKVNPDSEDKEKLPNHHS